MGLPVLAVLFLALPNSKHAGAASQSDYSMVSLSAGMSPSAAKIGDLDGDGRNDIAVVNLQGSLQLFFGNAAGSFDRISLNGLLPASSNALDLDIGDLNGDGRNDIAVAFSTQTGAIAVLINQGDRAFGAPVNYNTCNSSKGVAIGDLDQDGDNSPSRRQRHQFRQRGPGGRRILQLPGTRIRQRWRVRLLQHRFSHHAGAVWWPDSAGQPPGAGDQLLPN